MQTYLLMRCVYIWECSSILNVHHPSALQCTPAAGGAYADLHMNEMCVHMEGMHLRDYYDACTHTVGGATTYEGGVCTFEGYAPPK
jgi:hypothetical protein